MLLRAKVVFLHFPGSPTALVEHRQAIEPMKTSNRIGGRRSSFKSDRLALALAVFITGSGLAQEMGNGDGLWGSYFDNRHLSGTPVTNRVEAQVDFDWGPGAPAGVANADEFGARWTGELQAQYTEPYTLSVETDDGTRVWLNEQLIIDDWVDRPAPEVSATVNLTAGQKYLLRVEYYENHLLAGVRLKWSSPSTPKQIVPQSQLYSVPTDADKNGLPDLWESIHFGRVGVQPDGDADSDGLSNLAEYRRQSDPRLPLDRGVPNEWAHGNLGSAIGDASYSNGVFTVSSTGRVATNDIGGSADAFHFVYQPLDGNGQLVARVLESSGGDGAGNPAKVGVMVRLTLHDNSPYIAFIEAGPTGLTFQDRNDAENIYLPPAALLKAPYWIKAVRWSDYASGYHSFAKYSSPDGTNWTLAGLCEVPAGVAVPPQIYVGLAVASPRPDAFGVVQFDRASVTPASKLDLLKGAAMVGTGDGLTGRYYSNPDLAGTPALSRVDPLVNFMWKYGAPRAELPADFFSVGWTGEIQAQYTEAYTFHFESDDGVRLRLNDQLIIDNWVVDVRESTATVNLTAGQKYLLQIEYFDARGAARARLRWSSPSTPKQLVPQSQLYSRLTDADEDGLPDIWENLYFGHLDSGPGDDPDRDGLTNLQEYGSHTNPSKADTDGDGLPDGWEITHGLNPLNPADATQDSDFDGLTNQQEFQLGTNPKRADSDSDGVPDGLEVNYAHTDPLVSNPELVTEVMQADGVQGTNTVGRWAVDGRDLYALDRRGSVEFVLSSGITNKFLLQIEGTQNHPRSLVKTLDLVVSIDGENLGHRPLAGGYGTNGIVEYVTPFLKRGKHTVRVFWDDAASFSSLRLKQVRLQSIAGPDSDGDGIQDWVAAMVNAESGRDPNAPLASYVSPICLEGRDPYLSMMNLRVESGNGQAEWPIQPNVGKRWYANVPLLTNGNTTVRISYQNQAVIERHLVRWEAVNLLNLPPDFISPLTVRKDDSLRFTARPPGRPHGNVIVSIANGPQSVASYTTTTRDPAPFPFPNAGNYTVSATYVPDDGSGSVAGSTTLKVVGYVFPENPVCWAGKARDWALTNVPAEIRLESDPRLLLTAITNAPANVRALSLLIDQNEPRTVISRLGTNGPIVTAVQAEGVRLFAIPDTYNKVIEKYADGSRLVEAMLIMSPVIGTATVQIRIIVGGVTFDDGTTYRELNASDFDALGQYKVRFLMPVGVQTANCHRIVMMQGATRVGGYQ